VSERSEAMPNPRAVILQGSWFKGREYSFKWRRLPQFSGIFADAKNHFPLGMALGFAIGILSIFKKKK